MQMKHAYQWRHAHTEMHASMHIHMTYVRTHLLVKTNATSTIASTTHMQKGLTIEQTLIQHDLANGLELQVPLLSHRRHHVASKRVGLVHGIWPAVGGPRIGPVRQREAPKSTRIRKDKRPRPVCGVGNNVGVLVHVLVRIVPEASDT